MVCQCQQADTVIVCEQGAPLLDGKRHDSYVDVRDWEDIGWHLSYMFDEAGIGYLDDANITARTRRCRLLRSRTTSTLHHHCFIHLRQGQQWLKIPSQEVRVLEDRQVNKGTT